MTVSALSSTNKEYLRAWNEFEVMCRDCRACRLRESASRVVVYRGGRTAPLMIIGEAPGEEEDKQGNPFVGRSGQLLQNLLYAFGLNDSICHICNIVKCHPPQNRRPEPDEIAACKKLLAVQTRLVRPRVILLCGSTAHEAFFGTKPVMHDVRGTFIERNGYYILTTFHPAYALRNESGKPAMYNDIRKVRDKLRELGLMPDDN